MPTAAARTGFGPSAAARIDLGNCPFGKIPLGSCHFEKSFGKVPNIENISLKMSFLHQQNLYSSILEGDFIKENN